MSLKGFVLGDNVRISVWQYFDTSGNLVKEIDEDKKFGKIKPDDILNLLEKEGWIKRSTGEGRDRFTLDFAPPNPQWKNKDFPLWMITIKGAEWNHFVQTNYDVNGTTGAILSKTSSKLMLKE